MSHKIPENLIKDIKDGVISYTALENRLDEELMKPFEEQDFDLIDELNEFIMEFSGNNDVLSDTEIDENIAKIKRAGIKRSSFTILPYMKYMVACVAGLMLIASNVVLFSQSTKRIDLPQSSVSVESPEISLPKSEEDPYGIKTVCNSNGMNVMTPSYIPSELKLVAVNNPVTIQESTSVTENTLVSEETQSTESCIEETQATDTQTTESCIEETTLQKETGFQNFFSSYNPENIASECSNFNQFIYTDDDQSLDISIEEYVTQMSAYLSMEDDDNITRLDIAGRDTVISEQEDGYSVKFLDGNMLYHLSTKNIEYDTVIKIVESFA